MYSIYDFSKIFSILKYMKKLNVVNFIYLWGEAKYSHFQRKIIFYRVVLIMQNLEVFMI